jgi:ribosomal protein S18 acetylase RimI-like enzyme
MEDNGEVAGAVEGYTIYDEIYIDDFWVHNSYRGKGYGTLLMRAIEDEFRGKGFNNMNLCTSLFQAPEFYKKCGFTLEFIRENTKNPKLTKYFFVKFFNDEDQKQGLLDLRKTPCKSKIRV